MRKNKGMTALVLLFVLSTAGAFQVYAAENDNTKLDDLSSRMKKIEDNQTIILKNQETIIETLKQLKVWVRRN